MQQNCLSTAKARALRQKMTPAERQLWYALRDRRFMGRKVRRQVPIGPCNAAFYISVHRLIIEADGGGHGGPRDSGRDNWLESQGFSILGLWNRDILANQPGTLDLIATAARGD
jgi:very-short-patch-repair endonuclease